jgi:ferredoxin
MALLEDAPPNTMEGVKVLHCLNCSICAAICPRCSQRLHLKQLDGVSQTTVTHVRALVTDAAIVRGVCDLGWLRFFASYTACAGVYVQVHCHPCFCTTFQYNYIYNILLIIRA